MGTLKLEGETLGQKHQHYNKLIKKGISANSYQKIQRIDYNDPDIDNFFKIDIASKNRDIDYMLDVFKCEDMLYVSRAIKRSVWIITDTKYEHIINPDYLHSQLLPLMTLKAGHKLMLAIRLHLKNEKRVEMFYKYYEDKNELKTALKWLPNCSISYIENVVEKHCTDIPDTLLKRLCEKSIIILEICAKKKDAYEMRSLLSDTMFLLNNNAEKFINLINFQSKYEIPKLSSKSTQIIMKTRPDIILDNFEKFATKIDISTFVKYLKREEIKNFIMKHLENTNLKSWFTFETMKYFIFHMPREGRFDFIKRVFIEKVQDNSKEITYCDDENDELYDNIVLCSAFSAACPYTPRSSKENLYKWYRFAPFSIAFTDLKKLIRMESNPSERNEIFAVLITCAKRNLQNLQAVLQYYREKHMNEPFKFKSHFVNIVLSQSSSHRFDEGTWTILNDIFCSMEVYDENENNVQSCLKYIIVYNAVHDFEVPGVVERKFEFNTLKSLQSKLNNEEKDKVFKYLYQFITRKIQNITINSESNLRLIITHIISALKLLSDWQKNFLHYSSILEKINEVIQVKNNNTSWNMDLSGIYNVNKSWRKYMFKESLFLHPTQETCVNAVKHGPEILMLCKEIICSNDSLVLTCLLKKLRVYWPETLAKVFENTFRNQLAEKTKLKMSVRGLCVLLPKKQLIEILRKYKPDVTKITWSETDDFTFSIQKCFAKYMLLARPQPPIEVVLLYAKGDYIQFILPSMLSIFFNTSSDESTKHIQKLLNAPVSLQKHGLRLASAKLNMDKLLPIYLNTWHSTTNSSIRATVFKLVFELLCKEQNENRINEIWHALDTLIDDLKPDENRIIFVTLGNAKKVPLAVKQAYCIKSYRYLKSLSPKTNCDRFSESVIQSTLDIMEFIDLDFIVEIIFDSFDKKFTKPYYKSTNIISNCLLSTKSEAIQTQRYEKIFVTLLKKYLTIITVTETDKFYLKYNFNNVLQQLHKDAIDIILNKNMITPVKLFNDILSDLENNFSSEDYYVMITTWKLAAKYIQLIEKHRVKCADKFTEYKPQNDSDKSNRNIIYFKAVPEFGKICMELLKEDISKYFPSIYRLFSKALDEIFNEFGFSNKVQLATLKAIQMHADINEGHLLLLKLFPHYLDDNKEKEEKHKICEALGSHLCPEVRMHYQQMLREKEKYQE